MLKGKLRKKNDKYVVDYHDGYAGSYDNPIIKTYSISPEQSSFIDNGYYNLKVDVDFEVISSNTLTAYIYPQKIYTIFDIEKAFKEGRLTGLTGLNATFDQYMKTELKDYDNRCDY